MTSSDNSRISPTAHYTAFVWYRNGLSHPAFRTRGGRLLHAALRPMNLAYELAGQASLDSMLLARHRTIDAELGRAVEAGEIGQVFEVAAGLSPRGYRFMRRYHDRGLVYVEGDLPDMAARKRDLLEAAGLQGDRHHVVDIDALADDGPSSIFEAARTRFDPTVGTALITEGLLGYFPPELVAGMWARFARFLGQYPRGLYLSDLNTRADVDHVRGRRTFQKLLQVFARGKVYMHFDGAAEAAAALRHAGFAEASLERASLVHIVRATT